MKKLFALLTLLTSFAVLTAQTVPSLMNYQGRLTSDAGAPLVDGTYRLAFRLYTNAVPTTNPANDPVIWGREYDVSLISGGFNVVLGAAGAGPVAEPTAVNDLSFAFGDANRFLELRIVRNAAGVEVNRPILPRQQLLSAPYAMMAGNGVPPGSIVPFAGSVVPHGWLLCDGRVVGRAAYPKLFEAIGTAWGAGGAGEFTVPDLRGMFLRGLDNSPVTGRSGRDPQGPERGVGSVQAHALQNHTHSSGSLHAQVSLSGGSLRFNRVIGVPEYTVNVTTANLAISGTPTSVTFGTGIGGQVGTSSATSGDVPETRPVNAAVNYIIKY